MSTKVFAKKDLGSPGIWRRLYFIKKGQISTMYVVKWKFLEKLGFDLYITEYETHFVTNSTKPDSN
jgi:hypothetical protein